MNKEQALALLNLEASPHPSEVDAAYKRKKETVNQKLESAPTDALKQKFAELLNQLDEAYGLLMREKEAASPSGSAGRNASLSTTKMADLPNASPMSGEGDLLRPGQLLANRYEVQEQIGAGGMGAIYRATDRNTGEPVALKVLLPSLTRNERARERFLNEARLSQKLSHPNIVNVYDVQHDGELYFLTMELLEGQDLRQVMENRQRAGQQFATLELLDLAEQLCNALSYAHKHTVHRDLKPENIWLDDDGNYKLMDFGIAQLQSTSQRTQTGAAMGTAYYMAPEQLRGQKNIDGRADLYALAVLFYEMASGDVPAGVIKPLRQKCPSLPKKFAAAVMQCLQADPSDRYDSAAFNAALQRKGGGMPAIPFKPIGIAATVVVAVIGIGWGFSAGGLASGGSIAEMWESIKPVSKEEQAQEKAAVARIQGEINVIKQRLHNARRQLASDVRDAERNDADDVEALLHWQQLTDNAIFNGSALTTLEGDYAMAETLLREGSFAPAQAAMSQVRDGYLNLWTKFSTAEDLYSSEQQAAALEAEWQQRASNYNVSADEHTQAAADASRSANTAQLGGDFTGASSHWQSAQQHWQNAFDATAGQVAQVDKERAEAAAARRAEARRKTEAKEEAKRKHEEGLREVKQAASARKEEARKDALEREARIQKYRDMQNGDFQSGVLAPQVLSQLEAISALGNNGSTEDALQLLEELTKTELNEYESLVALKYRAWIFLLQDRQEEALQAYLEVIRGPLHQGPETRADILLKTIKVAYVLDKKSHVLEAGERMIALNRGGADTYRLLAVTYHEIGRPASARWAAQKALAYGESKSRRTLAQIQCLGLAGEGSTKQAAECFSAFVAKYGDKQKRNLDVIKQRYEWEAEVGLW